MTEEARTGRERLTREQWFRLPLALRQRWWKETEFSRREPNEQLWQDVQKALQEESR